MHPISTLTCTLSYKIPKTTDRMILRPLSQDSHGSDSTGWTPSKKISKVVAPRDTKELFGRAFGLQNSQRARLSFVIILSSLVDYCFPSSFLFSTNYFLTPRGMSKQKKGSFTLSQLHLVDRAGFEPAAFRSSQAERLCEPNVLRPKHALPGIPG